ncbi:CBS domain-containing protein [Nocardioides sp. TF02-7]|uniref:CBS domain-containing protein n=1 Tax=Nocardioides sp. TF02-7 TaxID=2917724 RepID=UPI0031F54527
MHQMTTGRFRHIPVCDEDRLVGLVSIGDLVKHKIDQLQFERDQLDEYVHQG